MDYLSTNLEELSFRRENRNLIFVAAASAHSLLMGMYLNLGFYSFNYLNTMMHVVILYALKNKNSKEFKI